MAKLAAQLKSYRYYTNASMTAEELAGYDCAALPSDPEATGDWPVRPSIPFVINTRFCTSWPRLQWLLSSLLLLPWLY